MLFDDGNRIDLTLCPKEQAGTWNDDDRLAEILLDKQQLLPSLTEETDQDYWVKRPSQVLLRLLSWLVGAEQGDHFSVRKNYKYLPHYLTIEQ